MPTSRGVGGASLSLAALTMLRELEFGGVFPSSTGWVKRFLKDTATAEYSPVEALSLSHASKFYSNLYS